MDGFEKEYIKNKLIKKKGKTLSKQPEQVFEDFAKRIGEIITNKEPIAAKIIREQSNKTLNKTNYLMGFQNDKKTVSKKNQANIVKPTFPAFQKGFVSHGAIDYDFAIMESKLEQENVHHENHGHDSHSGDSDIKKRVEPSPAPSGIPVASTTNILITCPSQSLVSTPFKKFAFPTAYYEPSIPFSTDTFLVFDYAGSGYWQFLQPDGDGGYNTISVNASTNGNYIPTSGWIGQSITITAA